MNFGSNIFFKLMISFYLTDQNTAGLEKSGKSIQLNHQQVSMVYGSLSQNVVINEKGNVNITSENAFFDLRILIGQENTS